MPMTIRPPVNASSACAELERRLGGVEVVRLGVEVLDRLGHDARAGGQDEVVVAERAGRRSRWTVCASPRRPASTSPTTRADPLIEQRRAPGAGACSARSPPMAMYMKPGW